MKEVSVQWSCPRVLSKESFHYTEHYMSAEWALRVKGLCKKEDFFKRRLVMASKHAALLVDLTFHSVPAWLHQALPLLYYTLLCISLVPLQEKNQRKKNVIL